MYVHAGDSLIIQVPLKMDKLWTNNTLMKPMTDVADDFYDKADAEGDPYSGENAYDTSPGHALSQQIFQ